MSKWTKIWLAAAALSLILTLSGGRIGALRGNRVARADGGGMGGARKSPTRVLDARAIDALGFPAFDYDDVDGGVFVPLNTASDAGARSPDELAALRQASGDDAQADGAQHESKCHSREPPIFEKLRNSRNEPIPQSVRDLADEITQDATNEVGKARAIYDWLTHNIVYDTAEWENIASGADAYIHDHDPESVLERGTTVCIGYAWLFDNLCEASGIESTWLIGAVRGYRGTADDALVSDIRHAWNAVKLEDGEWHLLDATWGALQEGESENALTKERADYYFDTPPQQFVYDHLPENEDWQLLENSMPSETAFSVLPNLKPSFFTNGIKIDDRYTSVLRSRTGVQSALEFSAPDGVQAAATIGIADDPESFKRIRVVKATGEDGYAAVLPALQSGEYVLRLYSGKERSGYLECSADFLIRAE